MNDSMTVQREKLAQDLRVVINDAEALLRSSAEQVGDGAAHWRSSTQDRLHSMQSRLLALQNGTAERLRSAGRNTQQYVQENPWKSIGIASSVALLAGFLMNRR